MRLLVWVEQGERAVDRRHGVLLEVELPLHAVQRFEQGGDPQGLPLGVDEPERHAVQSNGLLVGELRGGPIAGAPRVLDRLARRRRAGRGEEVVRQLGEMGLRIGGIDRLERLADLLVEPQPPRQGQVVVERVPDESMTEAKPTGRSGHLANDALGHGLVQHVEQFAVRQPAEPRQRVQAELPAHHRGRHEKAAALLGEPRHAPTDHRADPRRDAQVRVRLGDAALGVKQPHDLRDEQRVPLRLAVDRVDQLSRRLDPGRELDIFGNVALAQAP